MSKNKQEKKTRTGFLSRTAAASVAAAALLTCALGVWFWHASLEKPAPPQPEQNVEIAAVRSEERLAVHTKLNERAPKPAKGDNRAKFRIIEVIPHEACSVFPYLVDWKTENEVEKNVAIGYEGLMSIYNQGWVQLMGAEDVPARESAPYTQKEEMSRQISLHEYETLGVGGATNNGRWYRRTQTDKDGLLTQDGYFEYVGEGKGLYYVAVSSVTDDPDGNGIRYEVKAADRTGTQPPQGELYLADAAYYQAKEQSGTAYPDYLGRAVVSRSGYHYSLSFAQSELGEYVADSAHISQSSEPEYEYLLQIDADQTDSWIPGFSYAVDGNYEASTATEKADGKYVRISDSRKPDHYAALGTDSGYFRLATAEDGSAKRYDVTFLQASNGSYYANKPNTWSVQKDAGYQFVYAGEKKGFYDVAFAYSGNAADGLLHYQGSLQRVAHNGGRYALTSTGQDADGNPVYRKKDGSGAPADYVRIVTDIRFLDKKLNSGKDPDQKSESGVFLGGNAEGDYSEKGGFIFVPVNHAEDRKETRVSDVEKNAVNDNSNSDAYFTVGDRIYVTGQKRRYRYYCRDGFYNNEWFKLLCYSNNPADPTKPYTQMVDGVGYDENKTAGENLANPVTQQILSEFDSNIRIEIVQIEPQNLTCEDVKDADLLFFSQQEGFNGLTKNWELISDYREEMGMDGLPDIPKAGLSFGSDQDLKDDVLMTIYDECIWERNCAIIMSPDLMNSQSASSNLEKLGFFFNFFQEARVWAQFLPDLYPDEANEDFSRVRSDATVEVYGDPDWSSIYNRRFVEADATSHTTWHTAYFLVSRPGSWNDHDILPGYEFNDNITSDKGTVKEDETKLILDKWWMPGFWNNMDNCQDIWELLKNRKKDNTVVTVDILNAQTTAEDVPRKVIYADEFDPETFTIEYQVNLIGSVGGNKPGLESVTIAWEDGTELARKEDAQYKTPYRVNVRENFTEDGSSGGTLNPAAVMRKAVITAQTTKGKTGTGEVWVIVREGFELH